MTSHDESYASDGPDAPEPVRIGRLKLMALSPAHFHADEPEEEEAEEDQTASMELGSLLHAVVLKGAECIVAPMARNLRHKAYQDFVLENPGKLIVTKKQKRHVAGMASALAADPVAPRLLRGEHEQTLFWDWMGRRCRGTPDVRAPELIAELKTTRCAEPRWFQREADKRGYHQQLTWYEDGAYRADGVLHRELWIVAVESAAPYSVTCHRMTEARRQDAARQIRLWFERLLQCEAANSWPAYTDAPLDWGPNEPWAGAGVATADGIDPEALA